VDPPPEHTRNLYRLYVQKYGGNWRERKPATGIYNCAGLVWACRRTTILDPQDWQLIIGDDRYRWLGRDELPCPGDIAVYVDRSANDEILHVGRVFTLSEGITNDARPIAWIISKWNSTSGESMHQAHDVPYAHQGFDIGIRYCTDRPV
jgi:hypothetical protein